MKKTTTIALAMLITAGAHAATTDPADKRYLHQIAAGSIVCFTEDGYSAQMKALAQGVEKTIPQCGVASKAIPVIVLEQNLLSASKVQAVDGGMKLWVGIESIEARK